MTLGEDCRPANPVNLVQVHVLRRFGGSEIRFKSSNGAAANRCVLAAYIG